MSAIVEAELISSPMLVPRAQDLPPLTHKQTLFIRHYLDPANYRNGTQAARLAGYTGDDLTLGVVASENLRKPSIQAHIQHALKSRHISPDEVIAELSDIALCATNDLQTPVNPDKPIRTTDKLKALELAGKFHKLFDPKDTDPASISLSDEALTRIGEQVIQGLLEAAQRRRSQQVEHPLNPAQIPASVSK